MVYQSLSHNRRKKKLRKEWKNNRRIKIKTRTGAGREHGRGLVADPGSGGARGPDHETVLLIGNIAMVAARDGRGAAVATGVASPSLHM